MTIQKNTIQKIQNIFSKFLQPVFTWILAITASFMLTFSLFTPVSVQAQTLDQLNIFGVKCIFYSETQNNTGAGNAQNSNFSTSYANQTGCTKDNALVNILQGFLLAIAPVLATLMVIYGGYKYMQDGVDSKATGLKYIQGAVAGLVIVYLADFLIKLIGQIFGGNSGKPFNEQPIIDLINTQILPVLINLSTVVAVLVIIYGGYKYLFGAFNQKSDGKDTIIKGVIGLVVVLLANPVIKFIQSLLPSADNQSTVSFQDSGNKVSAVIVEVVNKFLIPMASVLTVFFVVIGAYYYITSNGDESNAKKGRQAITNAVIGLIIILLAIVATQAIVFITQGAQGATGL